ncbi:MAG: hypothetical protein ACLUHG_00190 [Sutterella wadsworthensis]
MSSTKDAALEFGTPVMQSEIEVGLDRALGFAVGARGETARGMSNAAEEVAGACRRETGKDAVKLPAALGDHGNKLFVKVDALPRCKNVRHVCL